MSHSSIRVLPRSSVSKQLKGACLIMFWGVTYVKNIKSNYVLLIYFFPKQACLTKLPKIVDYSYAYLLVL